MEEPTKAEVKEQVDEMCSKLYDVQLCALCWHKLTSNEDLRSDLYDIEKLARHLEFRVAALAPPAEEQKEVGDAVP